LNGAFLEQTGREVNAKFPTTSLENSRISGTQARDRPGEAVREQAVEKCLQLGVRQAVCLPVIHSRSTL
jgi:hypothetical protein